MRHLEKWETALLLAGGLLMVAGSGLYILLQSWAVYLYAPGSVLFAAMQMRQTYQGRNATVRRLRHIQLLSDLLFLLAALLMIANESNFLPLDYLSYVKYVHNNWVIVLMVAAILQLYTGHRIANELEKQG